jgi:hypothetical protein
MSLRLVAFFLRRTRGAQVMRGAARRTALTWKDLTGRAATGKRHRPTATVDDQPGSHRTIE